MKPVHLYPGPVLLKNIVSHLPITLLNLGNLHWSEMPKA